MSNDEMEADYRLHAYGNTRPNYVPHRVRLLCDVRGDFPCHNTVAPAGEYECHSNQWGAISVKATNGRMLGIKPSERTVLEWRKNDYKKGGNP